MSALGQKRTLRHVRSMSALPPKADIGTQSWNVRFVPTADMARPTQCTTYSITSSARSNIEGGAATRSALAAIMYSHLEFHRLTSRGQEIGGLRSGQALTDSRDWETLR